MKPPIVLCVDFESYIVAVAAIGAMTKNPKQAERAQEALADFRRAHATYMAVDAHHLPKPFRRQAE